MENEIMGVLHKVVDFIVDFAKELIAAPQIIWQWSEKSSINRVIVLAAAAVAAVMLLAAIFSTIRTLIKMRSGAFMKWPSRHRM